MGITSIMMIQYILFATPKRRNGVKPLFFSKKGCILKAGDTPLFETSHGDGSQGSKVPRGGGRSQGGLGVPFLSVDEVRELGWVSGLTFFSDLPACFLQKISCQISIPHKPPGA